MRPFTTLTAVAAPLDLPNVDTDRIIPARFLRHGKSPEYDRYLFHDVRFGPDGAERPEFVLNQPSYRDAKILVTAENFGCGSSREMAVWALDAYGIRAIVAPSLGDIFHQNCFKNGLLPVILPAETTTALRRVLRERPGTRLTVDLETQTVRAPDGAAHRFDVDPFRKEMLLAGKDEIAVTLGYELQIGEFERRHAVQVPWLLTAKSLGALGAAALRRVRGIAGARRAALTVYDESGGRARWVAVDADRPTRLPVGAAFPLELLGDLAPLRRGEAKLVDVTAKLHLPEARTLVDEGVTHFVAVPMLADGRLIGSLNVPAPSPAGLDPRVIDIARAVAAQLAVVAAQAERPVVE